MLLLSHEAINTKTIYTEMIYFLVGGIKKIETL